MVYLDTGLQKYMFKLVQLYGSGIGVLPMAVLDLYMNIKYGLPIPRLSGQMSGDILLL